MLVLTRKVGEEVVMPSLGVTVTVLSAKGEKVRLGFNAPSGVEVYRDEIWRRIRQEQGQSPRMVNHAPSPDR
jgi:carbon storage regulator